MWKVLERLSFPGRRDKPNEDGTVARIEGRRALFAVLDGVSSIDGSEDGYTENREFVPGGYWAMRRVQEYLERVDLNELVDAFEAVCGADEALECAFKERDSRRDRRWRLPAVAAIVVVTDEVRGEFTWAQVADCMLMHERPDGAKFVLENPMQGFDALMLEVFRECGGDRESRGLREVLCAQYQRRNGPGSYPVLDGAVNRALVRSGVVPLSEVQRFVLWSDGLHALSDRSHTVGRTILTEGLNVWYREVVAREEADPTFMNPLRLNNDDKSGLVIERV